MGLIVQKGGEPAVALLHIEERSFLTARVLSAPPSGELSVELEDHAAPARRAFSCLVAPVAGDRVLVSRTPEGLYVLAILERLVPDSATLCLPSAGTLTVEAHRLRLSARDEAVIEGASVRIRTGALALVSDSLTAVGRLFTWAAETIRLSSRTQEMSADTMSARALDRVSIVERADVLKAGSLTQTVEEVATTTAPIAIIAADEDVRIDAKRVTVG
jgi:hypothetical protein